MASIMERVLAALALGALGLALLGAPPRAAAALVPRMVGDINPGPSGLHPGGMAVLGPTMYLAGEDTAHGFELWRSDGTAAGTAMVKDIDPGPDGSFPNGYGIGEVYPLEGYASFTQGLIKPLAVVGDGVYFAAADGTHGDELWRSDGTAAGTAMVKDIDPGPGSGLENPTIARTAIGGTVYFAAADGAHGDELWRSDGTAAGTAMVKDINPGGVSSDPEALTAVGGTLYFTADDGAHGYELWHSDGTAAGTTLVKDINPGGSGVGGPSFAPTSLGDTLYFDASDGTHGDELWRSDGTAAGTTMVKDISPGALSSEPGLYGLPLTLVGDTLYFDASDGTHGDELWRSDGTAAGTNLVKDIDPGIGGSDRLIVTNSPDTHATLGSTLYFEARDGTHGDELWRSDGTAAGTTMVKDIKAGTGSTLGGSEPGGFAALGGTLYFAARDGAHGYELWQSDGTAAGTTMVADLDSGSDGSYPNELTAALGTLYFSADDGVHGRELWHLAPPSPAPPAASGPTPTPRRRRAATATAARVALVRGGKRG